MVNIISFKVMIDNDKFDITNVNYKVNKPLWNMIDLNTTSYELSKMIIKQVKWEYSKLVTMMRKYGTIDQKIHRYDSTFRRFHDTDNITYEKIESYYDVFGRDHSLYNDLLEVETYCIVAIENGNYLGHIYTWISPEDRNICLAMGIRSTIESGKKGISRFLLEGVRNFALLNGCNKILVPRPLPIMERILLQIGFQEQELIESISGISINVNEKSHLEYMGTYFVYDNILGLIETLHTFTNYN